MSNLAPVEFQSSQVSLPQRNEILDASQPFNSNKHRFRPAKQIQESISNYALGLVDTIEGLFQSRYQKPVTETKHRYKTYSKSWRPRYLNGAKLGWKVVQAKNGDDTVLRYIASARKEDGSIEKFTVYKNPNEPGFQRAVWDINGYLPGKLAYEPQAPHYSKLKLLKPGVKDLGALNTSYLNQSNSNARLRKVHRVLVDQAQWLVDIVNDSRYAINGHGKIIGRNRIFVQANGQGGKRIFLLNQAKPGIAQASKTFSVETNAGGEIVEIRQFNSRARFFIKVEKAKESESIVKEAMLKVFYDKDKQKIIDDLMRLRACEDLFKNTPGVLDINKVMDEESQLLSRLQNGDYAKSYEISDSQDDAIKARLKVALCKAKNVVSIGTSTGLLARPDLNGHQVPEALEEFYKYTNLKPGQYCFLFHHGGTAAAKLDYEDQSTPLRLLGPPYLREPYSRSGEGKFSVNDANLEGFFRSLGVELTNEEQNKAILRWTLVNNKDLFSDLGLCLERRDGKEIVHKLNPSGLEKKIARAKVNIPNGMSTFKELSLKNFLGISFFDDVKFDPKEPRPDHTKFNNINALKFFDILEHIGFEIADPVQTEEFMQANIDNDKVSACIKKASSSGSNNYKAHLALALAQQYLKQEGYTNFSRVKANDMGGELLQCQLDGETYFVRPTTLRYANNNHKKQLEEMAAEKKAKALVVKLKDVDFMKRTASGYELQLLTA